MSSICWRLGERFLAFCARPVSSPASSACCPGGVIISTAQVSIGLPSLAVPMRCGTSSISHSVPSASPSFIMATWILARRVVPTSLRSKPHCQSDAASPALVPLVRLLSLRGL